MVIDMASYRPDAGPVAQPTALKHLSMPRQSTMHNGIYNIYNARPPTHSVIIL